MNLLTAIAGELWAITPSGLQALIRLADRAPTGSEAFALHGHQTAQAWQQHARAKLEGDPALHRWLAGLAHPQEPEALARRVGRPLEGTRRASIRDGVALVPIAGPIFPKANLMTELSGATALSVFATDLQAAVDSAEVKAIVLDVDSPGGAVSGMAEAAGIVRSLRGSSKPIVAFAQGMMASGAYWLSVGTDEIVVSPETLVGSIGVVTVGAYQEIADLDGMRLVEITSSNAPNKRPDVRTPDGVAEIRRTLDGVEAVFLRDVAEGRGVSVERVISDFGQGGIKVGEAAVAAGMADRIGSLEEVMAELSGGTWKRKPRSSAPAAQSKEQTMVKNDGVVSPGTAAVLASHFAEGHSAAGTPLNMETLKARHPDLAAALIAEGATAERARLLGIEERAAGLHGAAELVATMKADGKTTPAEAADRLLAAEKAKKAKVAADLEASDPKTPAQAPAPSGDTPAVVKDPRALARAIEALQDSEAKAGRLISTAEAARRIRSGEAVAA